MQEGPRVVDRGYARGRLSDMLQTTSRMSTWRTLDTCRISAGVHLQQKRPRLSCQCTTASATVSLSHPVKESGLQELKMRHY